MRRTAKIFVAKFLLWCLAVAIAEPALHGLMHSLHDVHAAQPTCEHQCGHHEPDIAPGFNADSPEDHCLRCDHFFAGNAFDTFQQPTGCYLPPLSNIAPANVPLGIQDYAALRHNRGPPAGILFA